MIDPVDPKERPSTSDATACTVIRLGHAYRSTPKTSDLEDVERVLRILIGEQRLLDRSAAEPDAVQKAEEVLGAIPRPIYTFAGCLHPQLGTIGLILAPACIERCLQGGSRCDTGGLIARRGGFKYIDVSDVEAVLRSLSFEATNSVWRDQFHTEIASSYASFRDYVAGVTPNISRWTDRRSDCINGSKGSADLDRRLWTWEMRLYPAPLPIDFECLVLSPEAFKRLEHLRRDHGLVPPSTIRILHGRATSSGIHYFESTAVTDALIGGAA